MCSVPVYIPAGETPLAGIVDMPANRMTGPPVVLFPGGDNPRIRNPIMRAASRRAAEAGVPVLRLDYPGCGLSPGERLTNEGLAVVLTQACEWFAESCDAPELVVGGVCRGARVALSLGSRSERIKQVVAVSYPFEGAATKTARRRVREGLAALEPVATRALPALTRRSSNLAPALGSRAVEDLLDAAKSCRITLVYGDEDPGYEQWLLATRNGAVPESVVSSLRLVVRPGTQLYLYKSQEVSRWLTDVVSDLLIGRDADV